MRRLVVDTSSLTYRAFFALPVSLTDADGNPVNAVRGYLDMVGFVVASGGVEQVLHVFDDDWRPAERVAAYPGYKADRAAEPAEIGWQFDLLRRLLPAMGEQIVLAPGWEADDAIATICAAAGDEDRVDVLTGDRDLIQLVRDPVVRVLFTVSGTKKLATFDEAGVVERYGITADRYVDFAILRGDPSDGLPGIPGVGEKTARRLVNAYPDLPALLADADAQTPKLGQTLRDAAEYLQAMRAVVPARTDVALQRIDVDPDADAVEQMVRQHALSGPVERYLGSRS